MRELLAEEAESGDRRAHLAIEMFCLRVKKYVGAYHAAYPGTDAIVFTGGIGENSAVIRERVLAGLYTSACRSTPRGTRRSLRARRRGSRQTARSPRRGLSPRTRSSLIARDTVRVVRDAPRRW